jgi:four helix bundle protein
MAKYQRFEDLPVWQESARLYNRVLDLLETPNLPLSPGFRNQLDRAALSVSNKIADGFWHTSRNQLLSSLDLALEFAGEVRSMTALVEGRPKLDRQKGELQQIRELAESCVRQIHAWIGAMEKSFSEGKRPPGGSDRPPQSAPDKARAFRPSASPASANRPQSGKPPQARGAAQP